MLEVNVLEATGASQNNSNSNQLDGHSPKSISVSNTRRSRPAGEARWSEAHLAGEEERTSALYTLITLFSITLLSLKSFRHSFKNHHINE